MFTPGSGLDTPIDAKSILYSAWQAKHINMEFARLSKSNKPGNVKPETISHGFNRFCDKLAAIRELSFTK